MVDDRFEQLLIIVHKKVHVDRRLLHLDCDLHDFNVSAHRVDGEHVQLLDESLLLHLRCKLLLAELILVKDNVWIRQFLWSWQVFGQ